MLTPIADCELNYAVSYGRNADNLQSLSLETQPFWGASQGSSDLLKIPCPHWQYGAWFKYFGPESFESYARYNHQVLDEFGDIKRVWVFGQHDWVLSSWDPSMSYIQEIDSRVRLEGHSLRSFEAY